MSGGKWETYGNQRPRSCWLVSGESVGADPEETNAGRGEEGEERGKKGEERKSNRGRREEERTRICAKSGPDVGPNNNRRLAFLWLCIAGPETERVGA